MRLNFHHVTWYRTIADLFISIMVPFVMLGYWNINTGIVLRRRQRLRNRPQNNSPPALNEAAAEGYDTIGKTSTRAYSSGP
jgi:hypothetical protein